MKKRMMQRLLAWVLSGVLLLLLALPAGAQTTERQRGDVDGNGKIEAYDALLVLQDVVGKYEIPSEYLWCANVDAFGYNADASDALIILQYIVWDKCDKVDIYFFAHGFDFEPGGGELLE